jgi:hypothetical protein
VTENGAKQLVNHTSSPSETAEQAKTLQIAAPDGVFCFTHAIKHCFGKFDMFQDMVEYLFNESNPLLGQMHTPLGKGDAEVLGDAAHCLIGTVGCLGAPFALDAARRVERMGLSGDLTGAAEAIRLQEMHINLLKTALINKTSPRRAPTEGWSGEGPGVRAF